MDIQEKLKALPDQPGVYLMKNNLGEIIYVGKAVNLKNRVRSYFRELPPEAAKTIALVKHIAVAAEDVFSLNKEVDDLTDHHSDHIRGKIGNAALFSSVTDDVPFKVNAKQGDVNTGEAEIAIAQKGKRKGQKGQDQIFKNGDQVADKEEESTLAYPYRKLGMLLYKILPQLF